MSDDEPFYSELGFKIDGIFNVSERLGNPPDHETLELVETPDVINVSFGYSQDGDFAEELGLFIGLACHHVQNEETGRVFHARLRAHPDRRQLRRIRDYCDYLLKLAGTGGDGQ